MADGISTANVNTSLGSWTASAGWVQLHNGPPGASGLSNVSSVTTRMAVTWGTAGGGAISATNQPQWLSWAGTDGERVTDLSFWSASTSGTFQFSMPLLPLTSGAAPGVIMHAGDALALTSLTVPVATAA